MSDRFKFRVWDKRSRSWLSDRELSITLGDLFVYNPERFDKDGGLALMQSTGLKDKNGVLIFEGDVLSDNFHRTFEIVWKSGQDEFEQEVGFWEKKTYTNEIFPMHQLKTEKLGMEIIGNKFESNDLLRE